MIVRQNIDINAKLMAYIKYLHLESDLNERYDLDHIQVLVLNCVFLALTNNLTPKVGDILAHREIASQATIHAALKKLKNKKMISFWSANDSRAKYIELTKLGLKRFETLANIPNNGTHKH